MRRKLLAAVSISCLATFVPACASDAADGGGGASIKGMTRDCSKLEDLMDDCGFLQSRSLAACTRAGLSLADNAFSDCALGCFKAASCDQLQTSICTAAPIDTSDPTNADPVDKCLASCSEHNTISCVPQGEPAAHIPIPGARRCDGLSTCTDFLDESDCGFDTCDNGQPLPDVMFCDGQLDCNDASDEVGCAAGAKFTCNSGATIDVTQHCDGTAQCDDASDELGCDPTNVVAGLSCP